VALNFLSFLEIEKQFGVQCVIWAVNDIPQLFTDCLMYSSEYMVVPSE